MRTYTYVGPKEVRERVASEPPGIPVESQADLDRFIAGQDVDADGTARATFVVDIAGVLRVAPRRSEHVACAGGGPVLAAGELELQAGAGVVGATNQSTGFCPDPDCWAALAGALDGAAVQHPGRWTRAYLFRKCPSCGERNIVKDEWFVCAMCDADLPAEWNF